MQVYLRVAPTEQGSELYPMLLGYRERIQHHEDLYCSMEHSRHFAVL